MRADKATRHILAAPDRVFRAFTDPDLFVSWIPPEGMSGILEEFDPARGYRMVLRYDQPPPGGGKATTDTDLSVVRRVLVDPPRVLVEEVDFPSSDASFAGTMRMTWTFEPEPGGTLVAVEATDVPPGIPQDVHVGAMISSLAQLARAVEHGTVAPD